MSKLKLSGLTLAEILNYGYYNFITYRLSHEDWKHLQELYDNSLGNYGRGYDDGQLNRREDYDDELSETNARVTYLEELLDERGIRY